MVMMMKFLLAFGSVITSVIAQSVPQFNNVPANVSAGSDYSVTWTGGDGTVSSAIVKVPVQSY
jgi:hypothetical protein